MPTSRGDTTNHSFSRLIARTGDVREFRAIEVSPNRQVLASLHDGAAAI